jgi:hypothetical protein
MGGRDVYDDDDGYNDKHDDSNYELSEKYMQKLRWW